jgi:hypothetical protein
VSPDVLEELITRMREADPGLTARDVAEVLWLAAHLPVGITPRPSPPDPVEVPPASADQVGVPGEVPSPAGPDERAATGPAAGAGRPPPAPLPVLAARRASRAELRLAPPGNVLADDLGVPLRLPAASALPGSLALGRSLRPMRITTRSRTAFVLDEAATAQVVARTMVHTAVLEPVRERLLDLALVVDASQTMWMWREMAAELAALLSRSGVFRDVRLWSVDGGQQGTRLSLTTAHGRPFPAGSVLDPSGRTMTLIFTDCIGAAWADGRMSAMLGGWGSAGPVAIVQTLSQHAWRSCPPRLTTGYLRAERPGQRNAELSRRTIDGVAVQGRGVAVPVLLLEPVSIASWAGLVSRRGPDWVYCTYLLTGDEPNPPPDPGPDQRRRGAQSPEDLVRRVQATISPEAMTLARYLTLVPLRMESMRLVQRVILPHWSPQPLAEVFASGLLRRRAVDGGTAYDPEYEYDRGVRDILMGGLKKHERQNLIRAVFEYFQEREGSPLSFNALLTSRELSTADNQASLARFNAEMLRRLGGQFASAVDRWEVRVEIARAGSAGQAVPGEAESDAESEILSLDQNGLAGDSEIVRNGTAGGEVTTPGLKPVQSADERTVPAIWGSDIPARNPHFTGRTELLAELNNRLKGQVKNTRLIVNAVHGMGGIGKTQLVAEYAHLYAHEYDLVWWVPGENATEIRTSLVALADKMGIATGNADQAIAAVHEALRTGEPYRRWLLVFDNVENPGEVDELLPYPSHHLVVTTRNSRWADRGPVLAVDVFSREESIALLRSRSPALDKRAADVLAAELGDLPLALEQAAAWQAETAMSVEEYLELFREQRQDLLRENQPENYRSPVATTWRISFDQLEQVSTAAARLLEVMAFFGPAPISVDMLRRGHCEELPPLLRSTLNDRMALSRAVKAIGRFALARPDSTQGTVLVHRLVQAVIRDGLDPRQRAEVLAAAEHIMMHATPGGPDQAATWPQHLELSPHILQTDLLHSTDSRARQVILHQIRFRFQRGEYEISRELAQAASDAWAEMMGTEEQWDTDKLMADRYLANALRSLGSADDARRINARTYALLRRREGDLHAFTLAVALSIGADLRTQGRFAAARDHDEANLQAIRRSPGGGQLNLTRALNNLAVDYRLLGDFRRAYDLDEETLAERSRQVPGIDHFNYEVTCNLVRDMYGLGEYAEGLDLQRRIMAPHAQLVGADNTWVILARRNLSILHRKLGDYSTALIEARENFEKHRTLFGESHEHTLSSQMTLVNSYRVAGRLNDAAELGEQALELYRRHFPRNHPFTLVCAINYAIVLRQIGELDAARELNERALEALAPEFPEDSSHRMCAGNNLANVLADAGDIADALRLSADVSGRFAASRGTHPYTLFASLNHALSLRASGDTDAAAAAEADNLRLLAEHLGADHPEVQAARAQTRIDLDLEPPPM